MNNTMRQIAASVGTAILVTVMTTTAQSAQREPSIANPDIYGVKVAFIVIVALSLVGLILSFYIKKNDNVEEPNSAETPQDAEENTSKSVNM